MFLFLKIHYSLHKLYISPTSHTKSWEIHRERNTSRQWNQFNLRSLSGSWCCHTFADQVKLTKISRVCNNVIVCVSELQVPGRLVQNKFEENAETKIRNVQDESSVKRIRQLEFQACSPMHSDKTPESDRGRGREVNVRHSGKQEGRIIKNN